MPIMAVLKLYFLATDGNEYLNGSAIIVSSLIFFEKIRCGSTHIFKNKTGPTRTNTPDKNVKRTVVKPRVFESKLKVNKII